MFDEDWFSGKGSSKGWTGSAVSDLRKMHEDRQYNAQNLKEEDAAAAKKKQDEEWAKKSLFDKWKSSQVKGAKAVGNFVKEAGIDIKNSAVNAWQGIGDTARGELASNSLDEISKQRLEMSRRQTKERDALLGNAEDATKLDAENKKKWDEMVQRHNQEKTAFDAKVKPGEDRSNEDIAVSQKVDAKKTAFAAGDTFLNVATLGIGTAVEAPLKMGIKGAVKEAIKLGGTEVLEQIIKEGGEQAAKKVAKELAEQGAESLAKRLVTKMAPEAALGAGFGVVQTGKNNPDATVEDYLKGAAIGGAVGGSIPVIGEGLKTVKTRIGERAADKVAAKELLKDTERIIKLTPEEYAKEFGVTADVAKTEIQKLATAPADEIIDKGIRAKINQIFAPIKNFGERTQEAFQKSAGGRYVAEQRSRNVVKQLQSAAKSAGLELDFDLARAIEDGTAPDNAFTKQFREIADRARQDAVDAGLDIGYKENYVPHIWKDSEEVVDKIARGAGMKPRAGYERVIPTYEEGVKLGLKPKYDNPAQMMGDYVKNLETTRTNVALLTDLREQGLLKSGRPAKGWVTISAEGFPRTTGGNQLSAPKEVARVLNNLYGNSDSFIDKALSKTASFNSKWQDIALAGGIPHTPANFFTFSQMMKEGALGLGQIITGKPIEGAKTIYSPVANFIRSFSDKETQRFAEAHSGLLESLAKRGVPINFAESTAGRSAKTMAKDAVSWDKLFNEPTFGRFMPNMQLSTAKNVQNALEKKLGKEAALDVTAEIMKKMYGITDQLATGRSQAVQDAIGTIAFAPKYRESIIGVLTNTLKSLNPATYADKSYSLNRRLAVGIGATYMIYDQLNRATMGHGMNENPEGKELQLAIPYGGKDDKGNQKVVYIPFMPSFMTMPRAAVGAVSSTSKGDLKGVASEVGKFASMPIQTISQLATNRDYFGRPIVIDEEASRLTRKEVDSPVDALKKQALYVGGQASPAIPRAVVGAAQGKPMEQNLATAAEAPVRFGTLSPKSSTKESFSPAQVTNDFYDIYNPTSAKRRAVSSEVTALVKDGKLNEAKRKAEEYNQTLNGKFAKYYKKYGSNPSDDPMWDEMLNGLFIKTTERSFAAREKQ